ncbi:MAG: lsrD [Solirubrobacterales bacterium]|nr:lsrD [Solirubrobacterales bacterium]
MPDEPARRSRLHVPGMDRFSGVYLFGVLFVLFALWVPDSFLTWTTVQGVASDQAVTALVALAIVIPLITNTYDLSVGGMVGFALVSVSWLTEKSNLPTGLLAAIVIVACGLLGCVTATLVVKVGVNSFIASLAMSSILSAIALLITDGGQQILAQTGTAFQDAGRAQPLGIPISFIYVIVLAVGLWYLFEHTPLGRRFYAVGGNERAARLTGINTGRIIFGSLVASAVISGFAGVLLTSKLGISDVTLGPPQLLPAFAAAFLGATQIKAGRVNVWGTVLAVYVLATGIKGFQLAGASSWVNDMFYGVALAGAVALATRRGTQSASGRL